MAYEKEIDIDCFNDEQRPTELAYDCLEFWQYLIDTWKIDLSDKEYERIRDEKIERELEWEYVEKQFM